MRPSISYILIFSYLVAFSSCHHGAIPQVGIESTDRGGHPALLGNWSRQRLEQAPYDTWFVKNFNAYDVDSTVADSLKDQLKGKRFLIFMGTWCGDSKREVPRMYKILEYCGVPASSIQLVTLSDADSNYKQGPAHEEKGWDIARVPDLIILDHGQEKGRIIESPVVSLEKDLQAITGGQPYRPRYAGTDRLIHWFKKETPSQIRAHLRELADELRPLLTASGELKSYARILTIAKEDEKASITLAVNQILFPQ